MNQLVKSLSEVNDSVSVRCTEGSIVFSVSDASVEATTTFNAGAGPESAEDEVKVLGVGQRIRARLEVTFPISLRLKTIQGPRRAGSMAQRERG
jgi:hypothetical protein